MRAGCSRALWPLSCGPKWSLGLDPCQGEGTRHFQPEAISLSQLRPARSIQEALSESTQGQRSALWPAGRGTGSCRLASVFHGKGSPGSGARCVVAPALSPRDSVAGGNAALLLCLDFPSLSDSVISPEPGKELLKADPSRSGLPPPRGRKAVGHTPCLPALRCVPRIQACL